MKLRIDKFIMGNEILYFDALFMILDVALFFALDKF